jgi:hypothetical protein
VMRTTASRNPARHERLPRRMTLPLIGSVAALVLCTTELSATRSDSAEVRRVLETFVQGRERNAEDILRRSLSTDAQIVILQDSAAIDLDVDALSERPHC